jgi:3-oxoadipate enol-lactonase
MHYSDYGDKSKAPVVFIHGFPFSQAMWEPQVEAFRRDYRVITYDVRGHGLTGAGDGQYLLEIFVDDLIALLDHLKIQKAALVGLSMGGYIALRTVERNPDRVRAMVLCDTRAEADSNDAKIARAAAVRKIKAEGMSAYAEAFVKGIFSEDTFLNNQAAVQKIRSIIESNPPLGAIGTLIALAARTDYAASLAKISVPTLLLVGEKDVVTPVPVARIMQEKIRGAELHAITGAGHLSNLENPTVFNRFLRDFLGKGEVVKK